MSSSAPCTVETRLQRMDVGEARQPRHLLVEARIVLHRAGAERIEPGVDRIVLARQPHVMAQRLRLGEAGQADGVRRACAPSRSAKSARLVDVDAGRLGAADLEQQRLLDVEAAIAGEGARSPPTAVSTGRVGRPWLFMIAVLTAPRAARRRRPRGPRRVLISVRGDDQQIVEPRAPARAARPAAGDDAALAPAPRPAPPPACASADRELVEEMLVEHLDAGNRAEPSARDRRRWRG